jgi:protease-4
MLSRLRSWWAAKRKPSTGLALDALPATDLDPQQLLRAALSDLLKDRRSERQTRTLRLTLYVVVFTLPALMYLSTWGLTQLPSWIPGPDAVGVVRIDGEISVDAPAGADNVVPALRRAFESPAVRAVVLAIDSPGGSPSEAERIYTALGQFRAAHPKPVVAAIGGHGASAAYMVAIHCDRIYAGRYSLVGSIGALLVGWDAHELLARHGVSQRLYASGPLKSMMNPFLPMEAGAEARAREIVGRIADAFGRDVGDRRGLSITPELASGTVWDGQTAVGLHLVDEIATLDQLLASRWAGLAVHEFGGRSAAGFGLSSLVERALARTLGAQLSGWSVR